MKNKNEVTDIVMSELKIQIGNNWSSVDFFNLFDALTRLYNYYSYYELVFEKFKYYGNKINWPKNMEYLPNIVDLKRDFIYRTIEIFTKDYSKRMLIHIYFSALCEIIYLFHSKSKKLNIVHLVQSILLV